MATNVEDTNEDWDRTELEMKPELTEDRATPRNPPPDGDNAQPTARSGSGIGSGRSISELLKLHAEKGTGVEFSAEEASRVAEVLGQWINSESSPYEGEDDFFTRSQDDSSLGVKRAPSSSNLDAMGRPRGRSESTVDSRPASAAGNKS